MKSARPTVDFLEISHMFLSWQLKKIPNPSNGSKDDISSSHVTHRTIQNLGKERKKEGERKKEIKRRKKRKAKNQLKKKRIAICIVLLCYYFSPNKFFYSYQFSSVDLIFRLIRPVAWIGKNIFFLTAIIFLKFIHRKAEFESCSFLITYKKHRKSNNRISSLLNNFFCFDCVFIFVCLRIISYK